MHSFTRVAIGNAIAVAGEAPPRGTSPTASRHRPPATGTPCALPLPAVWPVFRRTRLSIRRVLAHAGAPRDAPESDSPVYRALPRLSFDPRSRRRTSSPGHGERSLVLYRLAQEIHAVEPVNPPTTPA